MNGPGVPRTTFASGLSALSMAISSITAARVLGPREFGAYTVALVFAALVAVGAGMGTGTALRLVVSRDGDSAIASYFRLSAMLLIVVGPLCFILGHWQGRGLEWSGAVAAVGCSAFSTRQGIEALHARGRTVPAIAGSAVGSLCVAGVLVSLGAMGLLEPKYALLANVLPVIAVGCVVAGDYSRRPWGKDPNGKFSDHARDLIDKGVPTLGMALSVLALQRSDRLILGASHGGVAVGVYSAAAAIAESGRLIPQAVGQVVFFRATHGVQSARSAGRLRTRTILLMLVLAVLGILLAPLAVSFIYGPQYSDSVNNLRILLLAEVAFAVSLIEGRILIAIGKGRLVGAIGLGATAFGLLAFVLLIPPFGGGGAAWASVVAYAGMSAALVLARRRTAVEG